MVLLKHECPFCGIKVTRLKRHTESVHGGRTFICQYCEHKVTSKAILKRHIESMHEGKTFSANIVNKSSHL